MRMSHLFLPLGSTWPTRRGSGFFVSFDSSGMVISSDWTKAGRLVVRENSPPLDHAYGRVGVKQNAERPRRALDVGRLGAGEGLQPLQPHPALFFVVVVMHCKNSL